MSWTEQQQQRLALERVLLKEHMHGFDFHNPSGAAHVSGRFSSNSGRTYGIRVEIPPRYPDQCPPVYITEPKPLMGHRTSGFFGVFTQRTMQSYEVSHPMHTLAPHANGWVQVCHFRPERWSASDTLVEVLVKVRLWLEAYELHYRTGRPIDAFLTTQS